MDQTYFTNATMLPVSKRGALTPRPQGDGMDSETLKITDLVPNRSRTSPSRGRQNLASSPKTATVSKNEKPHYIPHEPVRGAVKPLAVATAQTGSPYPESTQMSPKSSNRSMLNAPQVPPKNLNLLDTKGNNKYILQNSQRFSQQQYVPPMGTVKTINVPVYNAPGHLSHNTYKIMEKQQQKVPANTTKMIPGKQSPEKDTVSINMAPSETTDSAPQGAVALTMEEVLEQSRQVEGDTRTASMADLEKLNDEINELRRELENQFKVNTDLKKLLVASMGDDLHHKVDRLVQDKAQLAEEVGNYSKRLYQDYEDIDKLSIQADMWRSKFKASRVMTDQLTAKNTALTQNYQSAHLALQRLLHERQQIKEWQSQTHRFLYQVKTAFEPKHAAHPPRSGPQTLLSLAQANLQLADKVKFRLLGPLVSTEDGVDAGTVDALSPAEAYAFQVLSTPVPTGPENAMVKPPTIPYMVKGTHDRFHPAANYDNLTMNVCKKCKGEIQLV